MSRYRAVVVIETLVNYSDEELRAALCDSLADGRAWQLDRIDLELDERTGALVRAHLDVARASAKEDRRWAGKLRTSAAKKREAAQKASSASQRAICAISARSSELLAEAYERGAELWERELPPGEKPPRGGG